MQLLEKLVLTQKLFDYRNSLEWYDSDIFDSEIIGVLIEKEFILGYKIDIILIMHSEKNIMIY